MNQNYVDFGTPVSSRFVGNQMSVNLVRKDNTWWTVKLHDFSFGSQSVHGNMGYAIIDTGTSLLYLTPEDYNRFETEILLQAPGLTCKSSLCYSRT